MTGTTARTAANAAAMLLALTGLTACSDSTAEGTQSPTTATSEPTTEAPEEVTDKEAFAEAERAARESVRHDTNKEVPKGADWASQAYRAERAKMVKTYRDRGITIRGESTWLGSEQGVSNRDAPGGWDLTLHVCTSSTTRAYIGDKDVSLDADGKPLPKGTRKVRELFSFTTPDKGQTWQVQQVQEEEWQPCDE